MKFPTRALAALALIVPLVAFAFFTWRLWPHTPDDTFITLRYSRNAAQGAGATFNRDGPRAEGYTSFAWMSLAIVPHRFGFDPLRAVKAGSLLLGLLSAAACFLLAWELGERFDSETRWLSALFASAGAAIYPFSALHAVSGMETALAAMLLTLLAWLVARRLREGSAAAPLCAFALGLARPEANLAALALLAVNLSFLIPSRRRAFLAYTFFLYILPGAVYFIWRLTYYDSLLPLPFYVKASSWKPLGLKAALSFAREIAAIFGPLLAIALLRPGAKTAAVLVPTAAMWLYFIFPAHLMGFGHRFFHPMVGLLAALAGYGAGIAWSLVKDRYGKRKASALYALLILVMLTVGAGRAWQIAPDYLEYARGLESAHIHLGRLLEKFKDGENRVLAISDAGAVPYYSRWTTIDTYGLNDAHIAKSREHAPDYIFANNPTVVVIISRRAETFDPPLAWEEPIWRECLNRGLIKIAVLQFTPGYYLWLMTKDDGDLAKALAELSAHSQ